MDSCCWPLAELSISTSHLDLRRRGYSKNRGGLQGTISTAMDGVSILGTVVSTAGAVATLIMNVSNFVEQIRGAPQSLNDFHQELEQFDGLLTQIKDVVIRPGKKRDMISSDSATARALLDRCTKSLQRIQQDFPEAGDQITMKKRILVVMKKDTFIATRAHMQAVSQSLLLMLQKLTITETFQMSEKQDVIQDTQERMMESQQRSEEELNKLSSILENMQAKLRSLERHSSALELRSQNLTPQELNDPELSDLERIAQETSVGAHQIKMYYDEALQFQSNMRERTRDSDAGSLSTRIINWRGDVDVPTEGGLSTGDSGVDVESPALSKISSEFEGAHDEDDEDEDFDHDHSNPQILLNEVQYYQHEVDRQVAVGAFDEAKKNQRMTINKLEKLDLFHDQPFKNRVEMMQRLARITMQEGKPESYGEARMILSNLKHHVNRENVANISELNHAIASTYSEEARANNSQDESVVPQQKKDLLWKAARWAYKALKDRENLAGPPRDLVRESVIFLIDTFDRLGERPKVYAYENAYRSFLAEETTQNVAIERQTTRDDTVSLRPRPGGEQRSFTPEEDWLLQREFGLGPQDYINALQKTTRLTPLITAIQERENDMARRFIHQLRADINRADGVEDSEMSPLMWAIKSMNYKAVEMLLVNANADTSCRDKKGRTPMHIAVDSDSTRMMDEIYRHSPGLINIADAAGQTPLFHAVEKGSLKTVTYLMNRAAKLNVQDVDGQTPLHLAVQISSQDVTNALIAHKPDLWLRNKDERTPIEESQHVNGRKSKLYFTLKDYEATLGANSPTRKRTGSSMTKVSSTGMARTGSRASDAGEQKQPAPDVQTKDPKWAFWKK